jgi:hypothetical protein
LYYSLIVGVALMIVYMIVVPETREGPILAARARRLRRDTGDKRMFALHEKRDRSPIRVIRETVIRALVMLVTEPVVVLFGLWNGVSYSAASIEASSMDS